jgi:16S rRNA (cytosine967-C5)-methyltransferase
MVVDIIKPVEIPKYIRVNTLKADDSVLDLLYRKGCQFSEVPTIEDLYKVLDDTCGLVETFSHRDGHFIFQDKASALVSKIASPDYNDIVLDICAAPGVKTSHLAQIMRNQGRIISVDYDERRIDSWKKLMRKLGVKNAEFFLADATNPSEIPKLEADVVLLDPPCTGTGIFNEYPSSKWRLNENSIKRMADLQSKMIENARNHVKDNGTLVYSTCSITYEENEGVISQFIDRHPKFELLEVNTNIGSPGLGGLSEALRLYPFKNECQGFFIAKLEKKY